MLKNNIIDGQGGTDTASYASLDLVTLVNGSLTSKTETQSVFGCGVVLT
ncbi:MAG: hypothetical protein HZT43_19700 [Exiguobacterium profundum]|nr:MAG: hypothetical protein HZT43_19700 [Exiguobacterium profundum]